MSDPHTAMVAVTFAFLGVCVGWFMRREYERLSQPKSPEPYDDYATAVNELNCDEYLAKLKADLVRLRKAHKSTAPVIEKMRAYVHGRLAA